jgi:hypothetical protein
MSKRIERNPGRLTWEEKNPAIYYKPLPDITVLRKVANNNKNSEKANSKKSSDKHSKNLKQK